jgi:isopentenyl-diphosphate delta-isomerase
MDELLILVDNNDNQIGFLDKLSVHRSGVLHRAFSVFIFNLNGDLLLQQRALNKYHSPGLWSNSCCSHPHLNEITSVACNRRLEEEMGIICSMKFAFSFVYKAKFENGLTEHEFDHVYFGISDDSPTPNPEEVKSWKYISMQDLKINILKSPEKYTEWLKICLPKVSEHLKLNI